MYDVLVFAEMLVQDYLHLDLLWREAALLECMFLVDELDRNDGLRLIVWYGFAYAVRSKSVYLVDADNSRLTMHRRLALSSC